MEKTGRDAPFSSLKDVILFSGDILECDSLRTVLKKDKKGVSARHIQELTDAMYSMVLLGIYVKMTEGLQHGEKIVFGGTMDIGSRIRGKKLYIGIGVKYCALKEKTIACRVIGFKKCTEKTGLALMSTLHNTIVSFNNKMKALRALLGPPFPISHDYQTELDLENMESLAVDEAIKNKVQMVNKHIL